MEEHCPVHALKVNVNNKAVHNCGARSGAVGWGTALQSRRSRVWFPMVSWKFLIDVNFPAALWPWSRLSLQQKWEPGIFSGGVKLAVAQGWQLYHPHVPIVLNSGSLKFLEPSGDVQPCTGIACFTSGRPVFWTWRAQCYKFVGVKRVSQNSWIPLGFLTEVISKKNSVKFFDFWSLYLHRGLLFLVIQINSS